jgi:predicted nucleic acid-binding protein
VYLLDTNILSEVLRKQPNPRLTDRPERTPPSAQFTSCICVLELRYGSQRRQDHQLFWRCIRAEILSRVTVLGLSESTAVIAGDLLVYLERRGEPIGLPDALIAATALESALTMVTANIRHFRRIPKLRVKNWLA